MGTTRCRGQRGDQRGRGNLCGAIEDGLLNLFAGFEIAIDVLNLDRCVIDENTDGKRHAAEGHDVMVSPSAASAAREQRMESGMETAMISVERQLPQKDKDHDASEAGGNDGPPEQRRRWRLARRWIDRSMRRSSIRRQLAADAVNL